MMTRRQRLLATLQGEPVDRPAVSFYEVGGWKLDPDDPDPFNVYNSPDWRPLIQLAEKETDLIRMFPPGRTPSADNCRDEFFKTETYMQDGARFTRQTLTVGGRTMTSLSRRDPHVATTWTLEHLLKSREDAEAYLQLPDEVFAYDYDVDKLIAEDQELEEAGIVMINVADPIGHTASMFSLENYTVLALTEPELFHRLLAQQSRPLYEMTEVVARAFPGQLWRVVGSEWASEPFLPPHLYEEYVVRYTTPMVKIIQDHGGYARIHSHGRLKNILGHIARTGATGLDPVEPPPQGDMELIDVRRQVGEQMVLYGNIEASEIELLRPPEFELRVRQALEQGTSGSGRGFVLMPSACPYGRRLEAHVLTNYETMVRLAQGWGG